MSDRPRVLILGGSGHFGSRIARRLGANERLEVVIAGRQAATCESVASSLRAESNVDVSITTLDHLDDKFPSQLAELAPSVVVHSAGPFQTQDYTVAEVCLANRIHYVDLADSRSFVVGFSALDHQAREAGVALISGASTLPGLSSAVVEHMASRFGVMEGIEVAIVPGNRTPRGLSTVGAVLSYCGHPFDWLRDGAWQTVHGWQDVRTHQYPVLGKRWLGACDVPDLTLLPARYPDLHTLTFHAGLELGWQQLGLWLMAAITRTGLVQNWRHFARPFAKIGDLFGSRGSESGGMHMHFTGKTTDGSRLELTWYLIAHQNHGPEIPTIPACILARRLALAGNLEPGARPCLGEISLDDFTREVEGLDISWSVAGPARGRTKPTL